MSQLVAQLAAAAVIGAMSPLAVMATIAVLSGHHRPVANALGLLVGERDPLAHVVAGEVESRRHTPAWMRTLDALTPPKAFAVGAVLLLVSPADLAVFLSAMQGIAGNEIPAPWRLPAVAALIVAIDLCILVPLAIYVAMPGRAPRLLAGLRAWLVDHQRQVMSGMLLGFGLLLTVSGATEILTR